MLRRLKPFFLIVAAAICIVNLGACTKDSVPANVPIIIKKAAIHGSSDKTGIPTEIPYIGKELLIDFTDSIGMVNVNISTKAGKTIQMFDVSTPTHLRAYVKKRGKYTITFTLDDGSEYGGDFTIR